MIEKQMIGDILSDATALAESGKSVFILYQVNCEGVIGAGLAEQIKERFPGVSQAYQQKCQDIGSKLGDIQVCSCLAEAGYCIVNCFGQKGYGTDKRYTDYEALKKCLETVKAYHPAIVRIPFYMGCGLAGGDWSVVTSIIRSVFNDTDMEVEIWTLP